MSSRRCAHTNTHVLGQARLRLHKHALRSRTRVRGERANARARTRLELVARAIEALVHEARREVGHAVALEGLAPAKVPPLPDKLRVLFDPS